MHGKSLATLCSLPQISYPYHPWNWYIYLYMKTIKINHSCREICQSHGSYGIGYYGRALHHDTINTSSPKDRSNPSHDSTTPHRQLLCETPTSLRLGPKNLGMQIESRVYTIKVDGATPQTWLSKGPRFTNCFPRGVGLRWWTLHIMWFRPSTNFVPNRWRSLKRTFEFLGKWTHHPKKGHQQNCKVVWI